MENNNYWTCQKCNSKNMILNKEESRATVTCLDCGELRGYVPLKDVDRIQKVLTENKKYVIDAYSEFAKIYEECPICKQSVDLYRDSILEPEVK